MYETEFLNGAVQRITDLVYEKGFPTDAVHRITDLVYGESNRPEHSRHKAGRAAPGLSCVARFERSAGVFADRAAS